MSYTNVFVPQDGRYEDACQKFQTAIQIVGYKPDLSYNIALCHYMLKQYAPALKHIADIIEKGIRDHPGNIVVPLYHMGPHSSTSPPYLLCLTH